jgi:hypothetical protein
MPRATKYGGLDVSSPASNQPLVRPVYAPARMQREALAAERLTIPLAPPYPGRDRDRPAETRPAVTDKFDRGQNLTGAAGTGSVLAEIGKFAGKPDAIDLMVTGGAAVVELQDRLGLNGIRYTVPVNTLIPTAVSRERVTAFNVSDAAPATVIAVGKWALLAPQVEGYQRADAEDSTITELGLTADPPGESERY